ncbi:MAG: ARMT1-like domain-containing protein [Candidatus Cloacimonetes bacterium]|nr:ARMT1-like domain-containing protein [Candidatus Cloacimonadota bacterium]
MRTFLDCIPCQIQQALQAVRQVSDDEKLAESILRSALFLASKIDYSKPPALIGREIHAQIRAETKNNDPYAAIKKKANETALSVAPAIREEIIASDDPFQTAVRYAIAGNILDFALYNGWDDDRFQKNLQAARSKPINLAQVNELRDKIAAVQNILFIADNAGETVFDRLLLEQMPDKDITYAVKGYPIINDALREDAIFAGIDKFATIIDNGADCAGTVLSLCSRSFMDVFNHAELVIVKGQANFETLCNTRRPINFLTQIKCSIIARDLNGEVGDWVITSSEQVQSGQK